jgi:hypothetical protein
MKATSEMRNPASMAGSRLNNFLKVEAERMDYNSSHEEST